MHCIVNFAIFRAARLEAELGSVQNIKQCGSVLGGVWQCGTGSVAEFGMSVLAAVVQAKYDAGYQSVGQQCCVWHSVNVPCVIWSVAAVAVCGAVCCVW